MLESEDIVRKFETLAEKLKLVKVIEEEEKLEVDNCIEGCEIRGEFETLKLLRHRIGVLKKELKVTRRRLQILSGENEDGSPILSQPRIVTETHKLSERQIKYFMARTCLLAPFSQVEKTVYWFAKGRKFGRPLRGVKLPGLDRA